VLSRRPLKALGDWRAATHTPPSWPANYPTDYAKVAKRVPELRRAYCKIPWAHLYEYPKCVASIAVEREFEGENIVLVGRIKDPAIKTLQEITALIRRMREVPVDKYKDFCQALKVTRLPWPLRKLLWWLGMNIGRQRANFFGTFGVSVYSSLGAESLHPISPATTTLNYGVISPEGDVNVRIVYDHRVLDGATVARVLAKLEAVLRGEILTELRNGASAKTNSETVYNRVA
ncbi:MAG: hypothetical protein ACFCD0_30100, partial [Gemmataceae bacterium]